MPGWPQGAKLLAVIDACHSGSILDLEHEAIVSEGHINWRSAYDCPVQGKVWIQPLPLLASLGSALS